MKPRSNIIFLLIFIIFGIVLLGTIYWQVKLSLSIVKKSVDVITAHRIERLYKTYNKDLKIVCDVIDCESLKVYESSNNITYVYNSDTNKVDMIDGNELTKDVSSKVDDWTSVIYFRDNDTYFQIVKRYPYSNELFDYLIKRLLPLEAIFYCISFLIVMYIIRRDQRRNAVRERMSYMDNHKRELADNLYHELRAPLTVLYNSLQEAIARFYPCDKLDSGVCDFKNDYLPLSKCKGCPTRKRIDLNDALIKRYYVCLFQLDTINSVLNILADTKSIAYSNGSVSLLRIINNAFLSEKILHLKTLVETIDDKSQEVLDAKAVQRDKTVLDNGIMSTIFQNLIRNSIEANAVTFEVRAELDVDRSLCYVYFKDNGHGIRDEKGKLCYNNKIFNLGYTTKDVNRSKKKGILYTLFGQWLDNTNIENSLRRSYRGDGLGYAKSMLVKSGGDITIYETSERGTTFKLSIPVKKREVHEEDA